ncbi:MULTISPECIES: TIR domain-containing protein [Sphingobium]|uniref:TIR domain-containing protein n=1 Tax=Sphingobium TaxID=165695 RepID=UPI0015EB4D0E|nr:MULTISPECIES: TIR domain-containing protein [Sphingobium]MCW2363169.1 putative nucleotide-binding protein [Sphingobium sp. B10D3B]MCW2400151.1 putative nucleotide-binding protein [Sphingobium sp. B10D7B]MCW2407129.1 putative nucleotide-binding protein [Sphingobium xanthum]
MTDRIENFRNEDDLIDALLGQKVIRDRDVATALARAGELISFAPGEELIRQGGNDTHCYFILAGEVSMTVKGEILPYGRGAGDLVGEFTAINPKIQRTATLTAREEVVALRCDAATLKAAGKEAPDLWRLLAVELTHKVEQRNQLITVTNERPKIFMIAAESRREIADELKLALSRDYDVELWSEVDLVPPGGHVLDTLHEKAREADFGIVLAHPDDLGERRAHMTDEEWDTIRFELGYLMSELTRYRTLLMIPDGGNGTPQLFKGVQPMTYRLPSGDVPLQIALTQAVDAIREIIASRKVRSRLRNVK